MEFARHRLEYIRGLRWPKTASGIDVVGPTCFTITYITGAIVEGLHNSSILVVAWEGELRRFTHAAGRPALGDGLATREEVDTVGAVHAVVAEGGTLPAAEAVVGHRYWQRHVDADHANLDVVAEITCGLTVTGKDAGTVTVFVVIDQLHRFCHRVDAHHTQYRAENLFFVSVHAGLHVIEQGAADEVAIFMAGHEESASIDGYGRPLLFRAVDVSQHLVPMLAR